MLELARISDSRIWNEAVTAKYLSVEDLLLLVHFALGVSGGFWGGILSS